MAQLFGKGTIKSNIQVLSGFDSSKIEIVKDLYRDWKNLLLSDEVKYKEKFNQVFFGDLLGYENRINRIPEGTIPGAGSADVTLGYFNDGKYTLEDIQIVCELKGAKTNLIKKQFGHGGLSPVGQGFAYKTGLKNCKWLIVSNFYEIRLYRDNTTDFEVRNLEELIDEKDDYFNLRKLYLLLHRDNLLTHTGVSKTEHLLSHFREEQKEITKQFYKDYKGLRIELINDIRQHNTGLLIETIIEKSQKIIDRLIFIFFCEDKGLLPDKKLKENIVRAREAGFSSWEVTKKFFSLVDKGSESLGIPDGYNGGLFKQDTILDSLEVSDPICKKFVNLTDYNFDDELSVNVLGHIFEQSISDLENLKIDLLGTETELDQLVDTGKGRRKKDGIFYTPEYIVDYIVQNSVMKYLNEKEDECLLKYKKDEIKAYQAYQHILQNIKVLDPACGSGAFLVRVFDVLFEENKRVGSILNSLFDESETYKNILTNNIYGVDLNEESVEITKLSLWLKSAQKGKKLNNLDANIKCGNSLIDDPDIAGDKAFDWKNKFPQVFNAITPTSKGVSHTKLYNGKEIKSITGYDDEMFGFDVIVGNPPYGAKISKIEQKYYIDNYETASYKLDTYALFIEKGMNLLKSGGYNSYITPYTRLTIQQHKKLRQKILGYNLLEIINLPVKIFEDADLDTIILIIQKSKPGKYFNVGFIENNQVILDKELLLENIYKNEDLVIKTSSCNFDFLIIDKIRKESCLLENCFEVSQGLIPYDKYRGHTIDQIKGRVFHSNKQLDETYKKELRGEDVSRYLLTPNNDLYIKYGNNLAAPRAPKFFNRERILIREITRGDKYKLYATFADQELYNTPVIINIIAKEGCESTLKFLLSLINSKLYTYYHLKVDPKALAETSIPKILVNDVRKLPIKEISLLEQQPFIGRADKMLSLNKELHELIDKFLKRLQDNLHIAKLTKKLESFYDGDFKDFVDELKKQKISLSLKDQDEREPYFNEYREVILARKAEIERTDKEIDEMVFDLYGLDEDERRVVLGE